MKSKEIDRIECAIRHIQTAVDIDPWAAEIAIYALQEQELKQEVKNSSDLISRQAAIDALAKFVPYAICDESTESYTNGLTDAYNLICQLPSAQHSPQWIPVSERLPEENEFVLVTFGWFGRKTDPGVNIDEIRDGDWMISEVVTAWMPLPEPYRAERRADD